MDIKTFLVALGNGHNPSGAGVVVIVVIAVLAIVVAFGMIVKTRRK